MRWYAFRMTSVEIVFRYAAEPAEAVALALARTRDVYGMRSLSFDRADRTLRVDFDATRLNAATIARLIREAGLEIEPLPPPAEPLAPAGTATPAA